MNSVLRAWGELKTGFGVLAVDELFFEGMGAIEKCFQGMGAVQKGV